MGRGHGRLSSLQVSSRLDRAAFAFCTSARMDGESGLDSPPLWKPGCISYLQVANAVSPKQYVTRGSHAILRTEKTLVRLCFLCGLSRQTSPPGDCSGPEQLAKGYRPELAR